MPKISTDDLGFSRLLTKKSLFSDYQNDYTPQSANVFANSVGAQYIGSGDMGANVNLVDGYLQSSNFVTGSAGWQIDADGDVEFNDGVFRGTLSAASGSLGSIIIGTDAWHIDSAGNMWWGSSTTYAGATIKISNAGVVALTSGVFSGDITGATGTFSGDITAATGLFGGTIGFENVAAGTNANALNVGHANVKIDGANKRIIINDGTNDRCLFGYLAGKF